MSYEVVLTANASRQFRRLERIFQDRIREAIDSLADLPRPPGVKKLIGRHDYWRIRVGDYRTVYHIEDRQLIVTVIKIAHRRDVYRDE